MSTTRLRDVLIELVGSLAQQVVISEPLEIPKYRFDGVEVKTPEDVAAVLGISVMEAKARLRHVRTPEGARKYGQSIGSLISTDVLPDSLPSKGRSRPESTKRFIDGEWGIYGKDWTYGDEDPDEGDLAYWDEEDRAARIMWAHKESKDLGITVEGRTLNPRYHELFNQAVQAHEASYPGFASLVSHMITDGSQPRAYAWNAIELGRVDTGNGNWHLDWRSRKTTRIGYNAKYWADKKVAHAAGIALMMAGEDGSKHWSARYSQLKKDFPDLEDDQLAFLRTTVHELGHTIARIVLNELMGYEDRLNRNEDERNYYRQHFWWDASTVMENYGIANADDIYELMASDGSSADALKLNVNAMRQVLSGYGGTNLHEMMAEIWAEYQLDPEPRGFAGEMGALMEATLEEYLYWEVSE